jgi:hypothetical protein
MNVFSDIIISSFFEAIAVTTLIYLFCFENDVAKWERRMWSSFKRWLRRQLRKSDRIVAWAESEDKPCDMALAKEPWSNWSEWAV